MLAQRRRTRPSTWSIAAWIVASVAVAGGGLMFIDLLRRAGDDVHAITGTTLLVIVVGFVLTSIGLVAVVRSHHRDLVLLSAAVTVLVLGAIVLTIFGLVLLPVIALTIVVLGRRATGRPVVLPALAGGAALALGLAVLFVLWVQPPIVRCHDRGVSTSSRPWWNVSSGSGSSSAVGGRSGGTLETPSGTYVYECTGDRLTEFRKT